MAALARAVFQWRQDKAETGQARRLVAEELRTHIIQYGPLIAHKQVPDFGVDKFFPVEQWAESRAILARSLPDGSWGQLATYMGVIVGLRSFLTHQAPGSPFTPDVVEKLELGQRTTSWLFQDLTGRPADSL